VFQGKSNPWIITAKDCRLLITLEDETLTSPRYDIPQDSNSP